MTQPAIDLFREAIESSDFLSRSTVIRVDIPKEPKDAFMSFGIGDWELLKNKDGFKTKIKRTMEGIVAKVMMEQGTRYEGKTISAVIGEGFQQRLYRNSNEIRVVVSPEQKARYKAMGDKSSFLIDDHCYSSEIAIRGVSIGESAAIETGVAIIYPVIEPLIGVADLQAYGGTILNLYQLPEIATPDSIKIVRGAKLI